MNLIDGIILGVLALSVLVGLFRGLISEVLSLAIWVLAIWAAWAFGPAVSLYLQQAIELPALRQLTAYATCFFVVLILGALVRYAARRLIASAGLGGIDRLFGMLFGLVRGVLVVTVVVFLAGLTTLPRESWWQQAVLLPHFQHVAAWLGQQVPADVASGVRERLDAAAPRSPVSMPVTGLPLPVGAPTSAASGPAPSLSTPAPATSVVPSSMNY